MSEQAPEVQADADANIGEQTVAKKPDVHLIRTETGYRAVLKKWQEKALLRALDALEPMCDLATDSTRDPADTADVGIRDLLREYGVLFGGEDGE